MLTLKNRTCVIAGGTGNIGNQAVRDLLKNGMNVALLSHFPEKCAEIIEDSKAYPGICAAFGNEPDRKEMFQKIYESFGSIDAYVTKTGILKEPVPLEEVNTEELNDLFQKQVCNVFDNIKAILPYLKNSNAPRIVLCTTIGSRSGNEKENIMDSIVKGAVNSMIYTLARQLAPYGITVNGICVSAMIQDHEGDGLNSETMLMEIPMRRLGTSADFSAALEYLLAEEAGFLSGEILMVNGGMGTGL